MLNKVCSNCKKELSISEFYKNKSNSGGISYWCKNCTKTANKKYYDKNKNECVERAIAWRKRNPKKAKAAISNWKQANKERISKTEKERYQNLRYKALEKIGPLVCNNCGCDLYNLLEINHMNGNGCKERKEKQTAKFYSDIINEIRTTEDLNILCRPCNNTHYLETKYGKLPYEITWNKNQ